MDGQDGSNSNLRSDYLIMELKQFRYRQIGAADGPHSPLKKKISLIISVLLSWVLLSINLLTWVPYATNTFKFPCA